VAGGVTSWQDVIELSVDIQMAIPPGAALWGTDKWGTAKWSKVGSGWTPVNCTDLVSLTFGLTRSSLADNYGAGQLTLNVRNAGGWVTGNPGAGQLVIRPGLPMRVRVRPTAGTWTTVWTGEVDSVTTRWDTDGTCTSTLIGADTLAMLAVIDPPETPVPSETLQARLSRLAGLTGRAGLSFLQVGAPGSGSLVAGTLAQQLVSEAMLAVNSYGGIIVASPSRPKIILWVNSEMNVFQTSARLVVTNRPQQGGAIRVCPLTFESDGPDVSEVANQVTMGRVGGVAQTVQDTGSIDQYGVRTWGRTDLLPVQDSTVLGLAKQRLGYSSMPRPAYTVTYHVPDSFPTGAPGGSAVRDWCTYACHPYSRAEVTGLPYERYCLPVQIAWDGGSDPAHPGSSWPINVFGYAIGISHAVTPDSWVTSMDIDTPAAAAAADEPEEEPALQEVSA
jgi:hypothetical protein